MVAPPPNEGETAMQNTNNNGAGGLAWLVIGVVLVASAIFFMVRGVVAAWRWADAVADTRPGGRDEAAMWAAHWAGNPVRRRVSFERALPPKAAAEGRRALRAFGMVAVCAAVYVFSPIGLATFAIVVGESTPAVSLCDSGPCYAPGGSFETHKSSAGMVR